MEEQLKKLEEMRTELIEEEGADSAKWERLVAREARPKIKAALMAADKALR